MRENACGKPFVKREPGVTNTIDGGKLKSEQRVLSLGGGGQGVEKGWKEKKGKKDTSHALIPRAKKQFKVRKETAIAHE